MTDLTALSALAIKAQSAPATYASPTSADAIPVANLSWRPNAIQTDNPEYTGTIHRNGPIVLGATYDVTFDILLRGPGGAAPPAADAFIPGRVLRALGFTENILSSAIPAAPEALGGGSTTTVATLGATAVGTLDLYKGLALLLASEGAAPTGFVMIRSYSAAKAAGLAQTLAGAPTGNYQIPKQLAYTLASTGTPPVLSLALWQGSRRYNFVDMAPSSARLMFPTSAPGNSDYPKLSVTFTGDAYSNLAEAAPVVSSTLAIPPFKGGKLHIAGLAMGGSSISLDLGIKAGFPPNPNKTNGFDPAQLTETRRSLQLSLNQQAPSYFDFLAAAAAQTSYPIQALYGLAAGNYVGFVATDARFNFPETQAGGDFFTTQGDAYVDGAEKTIGLVFPTGY
ncbi:MAG: hypothetical protein QOH47_2414 [Sphingomonadales bacterium]|jgi:hypothetical protein|nr:hypothetical protein [Sphingomonadales bacterium]